MGRFERNEVIVPLLDLRKRLFEALGTSSGINREEEEERLTAFVDASNPYLAKYLESL